MPRVPPTKDAKIILRTFNGVETYKGLGSGFKQWARQFCDEVTMGEEACGYRWAERFKVSKMGSLMRGKAETYFTSQVDVWWSSTPTLAYVIDQMDAAFSVHLTTQQ